MLAYVNATHEICWVTSRRYSMARGAASFFESTTEHRNQSICLIENYE